MEPQRGYKEAKRLLQRHHGSDILIANAYQERILNWKPINSEDGRALHSFSLFLSGCCNTMLEINALTDMNHATNLKCVVSKLPCKLREKWRTTAYEYYKQKGKRPQFQQLVEFIERHANMIIDPFFGDLHEEDSKPTKTFHQTTKISKSKPTTTFKGSSFATVATSRNTLPVLPKSIAELSVLQRKTWFRRML